MHYGGVMRHWQSRYRPTDRTLRVLFLRTSCKENLLARSSRIRYPQ